MYVMQAILKAGRRAYTRFLTDGSDDVPNWTSARTGARSSSSRAASSKGRPATTELTAE
jgi:hypothetical protein